MDFATIERLMRMLETSTLHEIDIREGNMRIRLAKSSLSTTLSAEYDNPLPSDKDVPAADDTQASIVTVKAGMAGTFYRSPAPGAEPFTQAGARIHEGDQLAIIEAMKTLNPVEAETGGIVRTIHVDDGGSVEPGDRLFDIEIDQ